MNKNISAFLAVLCLVSVSWAQSAKNAPFDTQKSQEELQIMKGILSTTISFVGQNLQKSTGTTQASTPFGAVAVSGWRSSNINAFYLYGQGAVFVVSTSGLRSYNFSYSDMSRTFEEASRQMEQAQRDIERSSRDLARATARASGQGVGAGAGAGVGGGAAAAPAQPQTAPKPPTAPTPPPAVSQEDLQKKLKDLQEQAKKSRENQEAQRAKMAEVIDKVKGYLIEALANYGDSLTTVKPNDYVTLVLVPDGGWEVFGGDSSSSRCEVVSAQKSWITDYKAGRLTMDAFKAKVVQYAQ